MLTWIDLETTGFTELDKKGVYHHEILEIGILITDDQMNLVDSLSLVIGHTEEVLEKCDDIVLRMHEQNGLFGDCFKSTLTLADAEQQILEFFNKNGVEKKQSPLCGSSIYLDRAFIEAKMPLLNEHLHYRNMDVSSVALFMKSVGINAKIIKKDSHRALDDIKDSLSNARRYVDAFNKILSFKTDLDKSIDPSL